MLTQKQQKVLDFLKAAIKKNGYPPTVREICDAVGLSSTSTVHAHLETLERKGYIKRHPSKNRSTEILEENFYSTDEIVQVPVLGNVAAGIPIFAVENIERTFPISAKIVKNDTCFMLNVRGDSMINKGIYDGDLVLVRQQRVAENGDIVIALLDDSATIKTFCHNGNTVRLFAANENYPPIEAENCEILGKVIGLYRNY